MPALRIGDIVWVNVANQTFWWPGSVISTFPSNACSLSHENDIFSGVGCDNLMVVKYLGVIDGAEQEKHSAFRLTDRGLTWNVLDSNDLKTQLIPPTMQIQYDAAMLMIDNKDEEDSKRIQSDGIFFESLKSIPSEKILSKEIKDAEQNYMNDNARNILNMRNSAAEAYDSEGIFLEEEMNILSTSAITAEENISFSSKKEYFTQPIDKNNLNLLDSKCTLNTNSQNTVTKKRENVLPWDDYFMSVAFLSAMRSKDPSTQVGACIVNRENRVVGIGYNGFPRGCNDDDLPWARTADDELDTKYMYVCHAEVNAILNKNSADVRDCSIYVALFPCNECAKMIIQSGIKEVVYLSDKYHNKKSMIASRMMMNMAGVKLRQYTPTRPSLSLDFSSINNT